MKRFAYFCIVFIFCSAFIFWTADVTAAEAKRELRVTFAWPTYIDPAVGSDFSSSSSFVNLYDTLVYPTPDGQITPHVAERWEVSEDGLTWTFYLRKGVKFHNGDELTAEEIEIAVAEMDTQIKNKYPQIKRIFIEAEKRKNKIIARLQQ